MHLIQLFLPVYENAGQAFDLAMFKQVRRELTERFGGATAFARSPARGDWEDDDGDVQRDDVILFEAMVEAVDRAWWAAYRKQLEHRFQQDTVLVRAAHVDVL